MVVQERARGRSGFRAAGKERTVCDDHDGGDVFRGVDGGEARQVVGTGRREAGYWAVFRAVGGARECQDCVQWSLVTGRRRRR